MQRPLRVAAIVAATTITTALATSACGDSSSSSSDSGSTTSLAAFRKAATPLCEDAADAMSKTVLPTSFPATLDEFDPKSEALLAAIEEPFTKLSKLDAPKGHEDEFASFSHAAADSVDQAKQLRSLVEAKNEDTDALYLPVVNVKTNLGTMMNAADELGLDACTDLAFSEG